MQLKVQSSIRAVLVEYIIPQIRSSYFNWTARYKRRRLSTLGLCALREAHMERFVHNEYLIHLRKQLAGTTDEAKRRQTSTLLAEEEVKDHLPPKEK
jgi:hypothetical protein